MKRHNFGDLRVLVFKRFEGFGEDLEVKNVLGEVKCVLMWKIKFLWIKTD